MKALIFDVDGTLAETEELHRTAFNRAFAEAGLDWHWDRARYCDLLTTTGGKERIARHAADLGITAPVAALHAAKTQIFTGLVQGIALRPGIAELIDDARQQGLRLAVATTTTPANVEAICLATFGKPAGEIFDVIAAGDVVAAKKPAPDVYLLALRQLGIGPDEAVAFEDSANGVLAARAAGLRVVLSRGVYTRHEPDVGATLDIGCFSELGGVRTIRTSFPAR